jgi:hypothetical protein
MIPDVATVVSKTSGKNKGRRRVIRGSFTEDGTGSDPATKGNVTVWGSFCVSVTHLTEVEAACGKGQPLGVGQQEVRI